MYKYIYIHFISTHLYALKFCKVNRAFFPLCMELNMPKEIKRNTGRRVSL